MKLPFIHQIKEVPLEELKQYYKPKEFIEYCKKCEHYNKIWACPPYDFDASKLLEGYTYAYIIGSKLNVKDLGETFKSLITSSDYEYAAGEIYHAARVELDKELYAGTKGIDNILLLLAGRCLVCGHCARERQLPCFYPEKIHYSLESLGFDVAALCENILGDRLLWATDKLQEYFILVSAVFSREKLDIKL